MDDRRQVRPYGERAVLLQCSAAEDPLGLVAAVRAELGDDDHEVVDLVPGARTVLISLQNAPTAELVERLAGVAALPAPNHDAEPIIISVTYDGADLAEVAGLLGRTPDQVISLHTDQIWTVAFCGFAPGFGYLRGEHDLLAVPRRSSPRTRVPAGAVALADTWSGIYPRPGPGGWQLIGHTEISLWDSDAEPPALLQPGGRVRFVPSS